MSLQANCPACGAPVTFNISTSLVTICPFCKSAVGRGDKGLEDLGKVADLVETQSPLDVGIKGRFQGVPFTLVGRTQFKHPAGGVWDEWYAAFGDGRWGWLAEAQGRFYLTFEKPTPANVPRYDALKLGETINVGDGMELMVAEKNRGTIAGVVGEIPYRVTPGFAFPFADLSGNKGEFGTIDYGDKEPILYVGRQVTLDELTIPPGKRRTFPGQEPKIQAVQLNCPHCGAPLTLRAPDKSERVGCPSCGSLLDVNEGKLKLLQSLKPPRVQPIIPLGAVGKREGVEWTCIGFMERFVTLEGVDYFWEEYLLYQPRLGFRWLTRSDDHWNWVESVPPASVGGQGRQAIYADKTFKLFQKATAKVSFVIGEFYWKVEANEKVRSEDFVYPPEMLSLEMTKEEGEGEINWSHGMYLRPDEVQTMFALKELLPQPTTIGPNQPFPHSGVYRVALGLLAALFVLALLWWVASPGTTVFRHTYTLSGLPKDQRAHKIIVDDPLALRGGRNIKVLLTPKSPGTWVHMQGSLREARPAPEPGKPASNKPLQVRPFSFLASDQRTSYVYLTSAPRGPYTLQFDLAPQTPQAPIVVEVAIEQGVAHLSPVVWTMFLLALIPFLVALYQLYWESRRWQDSNVT